MTTSGKAWREAREQGVELTFPTSRMTAAVRPIDVDFFVVSGQVPDALAPTIMKMINGEPYKNEIPASEQVVQSKEWMTFLNQLVTYAFVTPKVVELPQADDEISVWDVPYRDKLFLYQFFSLPVHLLRTFREKQKQPVVAVDGKQNHEQGAEPVSQLEGVGQSHPGDA